MFNNTLHHVKAASVRLMGRVVGIVMMFFVPTIASAQSYILNKSGVGETITDTTGLGSTSPVSVGALLVSGFLGLLALLAVGFIVYGGMRWMTSGGNEETVQKAQGILKAAIIGLLIIMAAWGITLYLITKYATVTGTQVLGQQEASTEE